MSVSNNCLLCLQHRHDLFKVFGKRGRELNTGSTLNEHFWFEVSESDGKSICEKCWSTVQNFHDFYNFVKLTHQHQSILNIKPVIVEANKRIEIVESLDTIKEEPSIDIENDIDDCSYDILDTPQSPAGEPCMDTPPASKPCMDTPQSPAGEPCMDTLHSPAAESCMETELNTATDLPTVKRRKYRRSHQYKTDSHTTLLSTYFNMNCELCDTLLSSYHNTKKHYKHVHNINKGYLICCGKKFFQLTYMLQHCQWHINPEFFKCDHCRKNFRCKNSLRVHMQQHHAPEQEKVFSCNKCGDTFFNLTLLKVHMKKWHTSQSPIEGGNVHSTEAKQKFQCDICNRLFTKSYYLTSHMKVKHVKDEDKQFECYICRKRFAFLSYLKGHIKRIHRDVQSHICEVCAKPFKCRKEYELHYRNIHTNISQKVQCDKCGKWLKRKESLAKHFRSHRKPSETCPICGRVCRRIGDHIRFVHREASLECTICGKMFKRQLILKEHMAIHAGITDLYKCKFCTRTFRSSANMFSHRKRAHPAELKQENES